MVISPLTRRPTQGSVHMNDAEAKRIGKQFLRQWQRERPAFRLANQLQAFQELEDQVRRALVGRSATNPDHMFRHHRVVPTNGPADGCAEPRAACK